MQELALGEGCEAPFPLDGTWLIHPQPARWNGDEPPPDNDPAWREILVPGAWEAQGFPPAAEGPFWYRRGFDLIPSTEGRRVFLRFHGVSTRCRVYLNDRVLGEHEGIWDGIECEITGHLNTGAQELRLLVQKAGDALPLRGAVAGFLPDVCVLFGGIWRQVEMVFKRSISITGAHIETDARERRLRVTVRGERLAGGRGQLSLFVLDPQGREAARTHRILSGMEGAFVERCDLLFPEIDLWETERPSLYTLHIQAADGDDLSDRAVRRFGWRDLKAEGGRLLLNGHPVLLRGLLHWGWYPRTAAPGPFREQIRVELSLAREAGFNLIKHCLYVPVEDYYDLADESGMLLWQELPLWLPDMSPALEEKVNLQYPRIMERLHSHPSLVLCSLGCELNAEAGEQFLGGLYGCVKEIVGPVLVRDNSGSGECYGGLLNEHADYYDYHFYTDPHFYRPLMDRFAAPWRERKPWLFGEFCDQDTVRDIIGLRAAYGGADPWWMAPPAVAGLTREMGCKEERARLAAAGLTERYEELVDSSRRKELAYRRAVLETVRQYDRLTGYVLTGLRDTPLGTSGFMDDFGRVKHPAEEWRQFNADTLLTLAWDNRRAWVKGGDRVQYCDQYNYLAGQTIRAHLVVSHFGRHPLLAGRIAWELAAGGENPLAHGLLGVEQRIAPGSLCELSMIEFPAPEVTRITPCRLRVTLEGSEDGGGKSFSNSWPLWLYAHADLTLPDGVVRRDPYGLLPGFEAPEWTGREKAEEALLVSTLWDREVEDWVEKGGRALYLQAGDGPLPAVPGPFWREAVQVFSDRALFRGFDDEGYCGLQWYSMASDRAWDLAELDRFFSGRAVLRPLLRRLDTRQYLVREYAVEMHLERGVALLSTLRLAGGLGDQASSFERTVAGKALLARLIRALDIRKSKFPHVGAQ